MAQDFDKLVEILKDNNSSWSRKEAVKSLRELGDVRAIEPLLYALRDPDSEVRLAVANALGELGWKPSLDANRAAYWIAKRNWEQCATLGSVSLNLLIASLQDTDSKIRGAVAETLDKMGWKPLENADGMTYWIAKKDWKQCVKFGPIAVNPLIASLNYLSAVEGHEVKKSLVQIGKHATKPLIAALKKKDPELQKILWILAELNDASTVMPIITVLQDHTNDRGARLAAAEVLGGLGDTRAIKPLITALEDNEINMAAAEALTRLGWEPADDETSVRYWIAKQNWEQCLSLGSIAVVPLISMLQNNQDDMTGVKAAELLGEIGDTRAIRPLLDCVTDQDGFVGAKLWQIREEAAKALRKLGTVDTKSLVSALAHNNWRVRAASVMVLGYGGTHSLLPLIATLIREDEHIDVRIKAAKALGKIKDEKAVEALVAAMKDDNRRLKLAATRALNSLTEQIVKQEKPTVLVVEDDPDLNIGLCKFLKIAGDFKVMSASNGNEALSKLIIEEEPDLVLLDIMMPGMNGYETFKQLHSNYNIPVVFLTAKGKKEDIYRASRLGATDYITKPFDSNELLATCKTVLEIHSTEDKIEENNRLHEEINRLRRQHQELLQRIATLEDSIYHGKIQPVSTPELVRLVSGIVHDLRNGLGVIRNTVGFIQDIVDQDSSEATDLQKIARSTDFCEVILRNLVELSGGDMFRPTQVNVEDVVREIYFLLERKLVDVKLIVDSSPDTPSIMADEGQLKQVFMNLIKNAGEAMPDGGLLTIRIRQKGKMMRIDISDTGRGISLENIGQIYNLHFTTKSGGAGIGLHIVQNIVSRHSGTIEVNSEVGNGTTFVLHLPIE